MKPLHVAVIVGGAILAGGLAVVMTQPPNLPAPAPLPAAAPVVTPVPVPASTPPAPVPHRSTPPASTAAPPPVYAPRPEPTGRRKPFPPPAPVAKVNPPPLTLKPAPYDAPASPVTPRRQATLLPGMQIAVRLSQPVSSDHAAAGDSFAAFLAEPIVVDGLVIAEKGARATVQVIDSQGTPGGIQLGLSNVQTVDGQRVALSSEPWTKRESRAGEIMGTILEALGGSGRDASKPVSISPETLIRFRLAAKVTITERQL